MSGMFRTNIYMSMNWGRSRSIKKKNERRILDIFDTEENISLMQTALYQGDAGFRSLFDNDDLHGFQGYRFGAESISVFAVYRYDGILRTAVQIHDKGGVATVSIL